MKVFEAINATIADLRMWRVLADVSDENLHSEWIYVQDNPVRQGLVQKREDWPYYVDFINCEGSSQLPLQTDPGKK